MRLLSVSGCFWFLKIIQYLFYLTPEPSEKGKKNHLVHLVFMLF